MFEMTGRVALVTGAGPNIGREIAVTLARAGAMVAANDIDPGAAEAAAQAVRAIGGRAVAVPADVSDPHAVADMVAAAEAELGPIDALVNNAAITIRKGVLDCTYEEWRRVVTITLDSVFLVGQAVARRMIEAEIKGAIVNVASTSAHRGRSNAAAYSAAKAGVLNLTRCMAVEFAPHGIRVNSITPTRTGMAVGSDPSKPARAPRGIPLNRLGEPRDQAAAVLFMLSADAGFITGADLPVDGGTLASGGLS
jgi:NAD(P)-dependent dehydrogenase (short-subunit alcohol dehydrogenase family)